MPYIDDVGRNEFLIPHHDGNIADEDYVFLIEEIVAIIQQAPAGKREGYANYVMTRIVSEGLKPKGGWRYFALNRAMGVFTAAAHEFYRRLVVPYEEKAIRKNGDIKGYEN